MISTLDHVNIRTTRLAEMVDWYNRVLGMTSGPRPDFGFAGAWLYAGDLALVHLVEVATHPQDGDDLRLEHAAFRAKGLAEFTDKLTAQGETFKLAEIRDFGITQVNVWDPDGNHLHIDFNESPAA